MTIRCPSCTANLRVPWEAWEKLAKRPGFPLAMVCFFCGGPIRFFAPQVRSLGEIDRLERRGAA